MGTIPLFDCRLFDILKMLKSLHISYRRCVERIEFREAVYYGKEIFVLYGRIYRSSFKGI